MTLLRDAPCKRTPQAHSSKAVGEPPLFLGASVFFALKVCSRSFMPARIYSTHVIALEGVAVWCSPSVNRRRRHEEQ